MKDLNILIEEKIEEFDKEFSSYLDSVQSIAMIHGHPQFSGERFIGEFLRQSLQEIAQATIEVTKVEKKEENMEYITSDPVQMRNRGIEFGFNAAITAQDQIAKQWLKE